MENPGLFTIGSFNIATAGTQIGDWTTGDLDGLLALLLQVRLAYGSGGTSIKVYVQTTLDDENTATDIACFTFTTASAVKARNLSALTPRTTDVTQTDGTLTDDTSVDGILGTKFRVKIVSVGTYAGSTTLTVGGTAR